MSYALKKDMRGLFYSSDNKELSNRFMELDRREEVDKPSNFYKLNFTDDYIIKKPIARINTKDRIAYKYMLSTFSKTQDKITCTEFPIGYYKEKGKLSGLLVKYYPNGISLNQIMQNGDLSLLKKYYSHSDNDIRNLFLLFEECLDCINEMRLNRINYTDIVPNNIVIDNNQVRIIDFDPSRVVIAWPNSTINIELFTRFFANLVTETLMGFNLYYDSVALQIISSHNDILNYDEAKRLLNDIESELTKSKTY